MKNLRAYCSYVIVMIMTALAASCSTESQIKHFSGDGKITTEPYYGFIQGGGGYDLKFEPIKLDKPAHFTYRFAGLPHRQNLAYFSIEDSRTWEDKHLYDWYQRTALPAEKEEYKYACYEDLKGTLAMSLKDTKGNVVFQFEKKLSKLVWSYGKGPWDLYDEKTSAFVPDGREYILEVTINPDPILTDDVGYVFIRGVGSEPLSFGF
jgi:hypothetical protein